MKKLLIPKCAFTCEKLQITSDEAVASSHRRQISVRGPRNGSWLRSLTEPVSEPRASTSIKENKESRARYLGREFKKIGCVPGNVLYEKHTARQVLA